jgi:hypothetical protein
MKKIAQFLQIALLIFFLAYVMFFIFFDVLGPMFGMDPITPESMVKVFLTGTILFLASWGALSIQIGGQNEKLKKMESELNGIKAKLYDLEHSKPSPSSAPIPQKNQEDTSGTIKPRQNFTD